MSTWPVRLNRGNDAFVDSPLNRLWATVENLSNFYDGYVVLHGMIKWTLKVQRSICMRFTQVGHT